MSDSENNQQQADTVPLESCAPQEEKSVQQLLDEQKDHYLRIVADYENRMKRAANDSMHAISNTIERLLSDLIPLVNDINQAAILIEGDAKTGVELIVKNMKNIFGKYGIQEITAVEGQDFDANLHQAISAVQDENYSEGKIVKVVQSGYAFHKKTIIPAMVVVAE